MSSMMQKYSIHLSLAQINIWKDMYLCWEALGKIHHGSETHMSLSKVICALELIFSFCSRTSLQQLSFSFCIILSTGSLPYCVNMPVFISTATKNKTYSKIKKKNHLSCYKHISLLYLYSQTH